MHWYRKKAPFKSFVEFSVNCVPGKSLKIWKLNAFSTQVLIWLSLSSLILIILGKLCSSVVYECQVHPKLSAKSLDDIRDMDYPVVHQIWLTNDLDVHMMLFFRNIFIPRAFDRILYCLHRIYDCLLLAWKNKNTPSFGCGKVKKKYALKFSFWWVKK